MTFTSTRLLTLLFCLAAFTFVGCDDDDDPEIPNEEEVITNVNYTLTPDNGGETVAFTFVDPDGDGGEAATLGQIGALAPNTTYTGTLTLQNIEGTTVESIDAEVLEEDDEHQVFYIISNGLNITPAYSDMDDNGEPLGLMTTLTTGESSSGTMTINLIHEPNKEGDGNTIQSPDAVGGSSDVEVTFDVSF